MGDPNAGAVERATLNAPPDDEPESDEERAEVETARREAEPGTPHEEVLREFGLTDEERQAAMSHIEEGFLQAERGEVIDGAQARREIEALKDNWRQGRAPKR
jgi:hypothetical protein